MENEGVQCRERPNIRAERLEALVWGEVKKVLENPGVIVAGIEAMDSRADSGELAEDIAIAERELQKVQMEEDRANQALRVGEDHREAARPTAQVHHRTAGDASVEAGRLPGQGNGGEAGDG